MFGTHYFNINYTTFRNKYPKILNHIHEWRKKSRNQETFVRSLFRKKVEFAIWQCEVTTSNTEEQRFQSSLKIELGKFPIKCANLKNKAQTVGLFKEKILHDVTNKTLDDLNKQFKKKYNTKFTTQVKKVIYPEKMLDKEIITRAAKHNIEQRWKETSVERQVS